MPAEEENFGSLARINRELIAKAEALDSPQRVVRLFGAMVRRIAALPVPTGLAAAGKPTERRRAGMDRCLRNRLK
jgi:hypothetical protein